jgi:hypothetical protein
MFFIQTAVLDGPSSKYYGLIEVEAWNRKANMMIRIFPHPLRLCVVDELTNAQNWPQKTEPQSKSIFDPLDNALFLVLFSNRM